MKTTRLMALGVLLASGFVAYGHAQSLGGNAAPSEVPPASFAGKQFVDSKGCVYIRAGIDGQVIWVPQVNRQREPICGQTPSRMVRSVPVQAAAPAVVGPASVAFKPVRSARKRSPVRKGVTLATTRKVRALRTLPEAVLAENAGTLTPETRFVPRHVYIDQRNSGFQPLPRGYRRVWEDERLNTRRAEQSVRGYQSTQLIWTDTVPRRLINRATGEDLTGKTPLVYPYTDIKVQRGILSSRSAPKAAVQGKTAVQGRGLVQAAAYRDVAGAKAAAQRAVRLGVPVKLGKLKQGGEVLQVVLLGPFKSGAAQSRALQRAKAAGFGNARLR